MAGIIACALALMAGCAPGGPGRSSIPSPASQSPAALSQLPGWAGDGLQGLAAAVARQCDLKTPPAPWSRLCNDFRALGPAPAIGQAALRQWLETRFQAWPLQDAQGSRQGLITGYYEPLLTGSRVRESAAQVPLLAPPADLLTIDLTAVEPRLAGMRLRGRLQGTRVVPYDSRAQMDARLVNGMSGEALVWVDDPIDAFFLEIQGSGRVKLRDGQFMRVGYAEQNGHPYRAIGRSLVERGALSLESVSAQSIKDWLRANPAQATELMQTNPSMVFFRELPPIGDRHGDDTAPPGPPGSLGVPLTPLRSIAVDPRAVPPGSLVWLDTTHPLKTTPLRRVMAAQDTGGAITGAVRADVFWGFGEEAGRGAGQMKSRGQLWVLWPRGEAPPPAAQLSR